MAASVMATGKMVAIYFLKKDDLFAEDILQNIMYITKACKDSNFSSEFWTNVETFDPVAFSVLAREGVKIKDYTSLEEKYVDIIRYFVELGNQGDKAAYAAASDILRVAMAESLEADTLLYVYYDCNDTVFSKLQEDLGQLPDKFEKNPWGLAFQHYTGFPIDLRNDRMIVRKKNNPEFLEAFFREYFESVQNHYQKYKWCQDEDTKQRFITKITCFSSLFDIDMKNQQIRAKKKLSFYINEANGVIHVPPRARILNSHLVNYRASSEEINFSTYITSNQVLEKSCSWREFDLRLDNLEWAEWYDQRLEHGVIYINPEKEHYRFLSLYKAWGERTEVTVPFPKHINLANVANMLNDPTLKTNLSAHARLNDPALHKPTLISTSDYETSDSNGNNSNDDLDLTASHLDSVAPREQENICHPVPAMWPAFFTQSAIAAQEFLVAAIPSATTSTDNPMQVNHSDVGTPIITINSFSAESRPKCNN